MANPVFNKLEKEWARTPAGYPAMPGYTPGASGSASTESPVGSAPAFDQRAWQEATSQWDAPAADAVDRDRMTYDDVLVRTGICFAVLLVGAAGTWVLGLSNLSLAMGLVLPAALVALALGLVNSFKRRTSPALVLAYALTEGVVLGAISLVTELALPGVVLQAVLATAAVFGVTLALFVSGRVRNSSKLARITLIALVGLLVYRLLDAVLAMTGLVPGGTQSMTVAGIPLSLVVGVLAVLIGAACLVQDFDQVKVGVAQGAPSRFAWTCAFGLMVTIVWMYMEILRLISILRSE